MVQKPLSNDALLRTVEAFNRLDGSYSAPSRELGISGDTVKRHLAEASKRGLVDRKPVMPGFQISQVSSTLDKDGNLLRESIQQRPEPGEVFDLPEGFLTSRISVLSDGEGRTKLKWHQYKPDTTGESSLVDAMREMMAEYEGTAAVFPAETIYDSETFTVIPLVDWHVGLMAWARETGENYDLKIARDTIMKAMAKVIGACPATDKCIILGLGDMLHFDGYEPVTSRSNNFLDSDGRYPKVLKTAISMIRMTVDMCLQKFKTVDLRLLPGNHDDRATVALNMGFDMLYENNDRVTFDESPSRFWWHREGKVFLGATHGDKAKMKDMPLVMAHDRPQDWAKSSYRHIYTGHIHHESKIEEGGVIVTSMRSPVAKDSYHSFNKWRSGRSVYADTFEVSGKFAGSLKFNI